MKHSVREFFQCLGVYTNYYNTKLPRFKGRDSVRWGADTYNTEMVPVIQYPIGVTGSYTVSLHLSKPLCSELLSHLFFSTLPQRCQDRAPSPLHAASIMLTIQPSVEDVTTCLITVTTVTILHLNDHMLLHTEVKCQCVPVVSNSTTYEFIKVTQSGFGVKPHGNTWSRD